MVVGSPDLSERRAAHHAGKRSGAARIVIRDMVLPIVVFRLARGAGVPEVWSLVLSGLPPAAGALIDWRRRRQIEAVGLVVLSGIALAMLLALLTDDPKVLLFEGALVTAVFAMAHLISIRARRPLIFYLGQAFQGGRSSGAGIEMEDEYDRYLEARSFWRMAAIVWGTVLLAEAAVRVVVINNTSTSTAQAINRIAPFAITAGLISWTLWAGARAREGKPPNAVRSQPDA